MDEFDDYDGGSLLGGCAGCPMCGGLMEVDLPGNAKLGDIITYTQDNLINLMKQAKLDKDIVAYNQYARILRNIKKGAKYQFAQRKPTKNNPETFFYARKVQTGPKKPRGPRKECTKREFLAQPDVAARMAYARACRARKPKPKYFVDDGPYRKALDSELAKMLSIPVVKGRPCKAGRTSKDAKKFPDMPYFIYNGRRVNPTVYAANCGGPFLEAVE